MEERRLLLAVGLSLLILTGYSLLFGPRSQPPQAPEPQAVPGQPSSLTPPSPEPPPESELQPVEPEAPEAAPVATVAAEREQRVEVLGPDYTIAFTNRGARLLSWTLARYPDSRGKPEEMVPAATNGLKPLDVETGDPDVDARLREALFLQSATTLRVTGSSPRSLSFRYADGQVEAVKTLAFQEGGLVEVSVSVRAEGRPLSTRVVWGPGLGNPTEEQMDVRGFLVPQGVVSAQGEVERFEPDDLPTEALTGVRWVGVASRYFAALLVPQEGSAAAAFRSVTLPAEQDEDPALGTVALLELGPDAPVLLYVGAKDHHALEQLGFGLEQVVPVGDWIGPIVVPLMRLLGWVHGQVGNWGWAIVILTILINMTMAPLRHYSIANGMKMSKMQPEMRVIQERYRKVPMMDPRRQKMQEEMGELYARHGMSMGSQMLVGCLPLLLTMPFLFAFYRVLDISVELRGAPFLWIPDLSQKDPLFITPVLMGVSMFAMQKMTPTTLDPAQQRIMTLMPLMLAGMFLWAPAGLNLYWLTANIWSLAQQFVEMRFLRPKDVPAPASAKGKRKKR